MLSINKSECITPLGNLFGHILLKYFSSNFISVLRLLEILFILRSILDNKLGNNLIDSEFDLFNFSLLVAL